MPIRGDALATPSSSSYNAVGLGDPGVIDKSLLHDRAGYAHASGMRSARVEVDDANDIDEEIGLEELVRSAV